MAPKFIQDRIKAFLNPHPRYYQLSPVLKTQISKYFRGMSDLYTPELVRDCGNSQDLLNSTGLESTHIALSKAM